MLSFVRSLWLKLTNRRGTDVVEVNDTTTSNLDYAIPEINKIVSTIGNYGKNKTFSKYHGTPVRAIRGKAK